MKVLQLIQKPQLRGAEIFACQLSQELIQRGIEVDIVYLFNHDPFALKFKLNFVPLSANVNRRLWDWNAYKRLNGIINKGKYDIVQANAADTLKYAILSRLLFGWKARIVFRNASLMGRLMYSPLQKIYNRFLLRHCDSVVSVSENCRKDLIKFFPEANKKSLTIPIGAYLTDTSESAVHPRNGEGPIFLHIGSFVWEKNHQFLITIFSKYLERYGRGVLWLVGDGKLKESVEAEVAQLGLQNNVMFWGARQDTISFLKSADLLVFPSVVEGVPGVILESLASGTPVLASDAGGIPEILVHGVNGHCLSSFSEDNYVESMHTLTTDQALRFRLVAAGKETIMASFDMKKIASRFNDYYQSISARNVNVDHG